MTAVGKAAIVGTGTMGPGMGAVLERAGVDVSLYDVSEEQLEKAPPRRGPGALGPRPAGR